MGLMLPGELADLLNELGYIWPKSDETQLFQLGQQWIDFSGQLGPLVQQAGQAAARAWTGSSGPAVEAFHDLWTKQGSAVDVLDSDVLASMVIGIAVIICAVVVLMLKIMVIVQLTILLIEIIQAIATAPPTFGASLLEIPVFKKLCDLAINFLISKALEAVLG